MEHYCSECNLFIKDEDVDIIERQTYGIVERICTCPKCGGYLSQDIPDEESKFYYFPFKCMTFGGRDNDL